MLDWTVLSQSIAHEPKGSLHRPKQGINQSIKEIEYEVPIY